MMNDLAKLTSMEKGQKRDHGISIDWKLSLKKKFLQSLKEKHFLNIFMVIQLQLYAFSPHPSTPPQLNPPPSSTCTLPLGYVHVSIIVVPVIPSSHCPPPTIVRLFLTSMSLVIFCFLFSSIDYVPVKGEILWYLSLTTWLISLSIMLSSSIHAVAKGISSFFLSAVYNSIV